MGETLTLLTIDHEAHRPFWEAVDTDRLTYPHNNSFLLRYLGAFEVPAKYDNYIIENLQSLSYLKYNPLLRGKNNIALVADGLPYILDERPEWYYNSLRTSDSIPKFVRNFYLREVKKGLKMLDGAIVISPVLKKYLSKIYNGPIEVCPPSMSEEKIEYLEQIEPSSSPSVFSVIRSSEWKGLDLLLEAVEIAREEVENLQLNLKIHREYYRKNREKLDRDYINLHMEWYSPEKYAELFSENMIYVQASHFEPHGVAVSEAMCGGLKPVVAERVGAKQLFEDEFPELVREHSPEDLAEGIIKQIKIDKGKREEESHRMRELSKQVYPEKSRERFREKFEKLKQ
ncbi:MAG: glycosyltransferase [Candidatus Nanohalobium sp.]